jgi:autotransporter-associated beta strand protein
VSRWARLLIIACAFALVPVAIASIGVQVARAANCTTTCTWSGATSGSWSVATNWQGGQAPANNATLVFPSGATTLSTTNNLSNLTFKGITIEGSGYTLAGNSVTLKATTQPALSDTSTSGSNTISLTMVLGSAETINVTDAAETLNVSGVISGSYALTKSGSGTLVLSDASNSFTSSVITGGILQVGIDGDLGTAPSSAKTDITFDGSGATLATTGSFALSTTRELAFTLPGTIDVAPTTTLTYDGIATGTNEGLIKTDAGTLVLSGVSTYTGSTTIEGGIVSIGADDNLGKTPTSTLVGDLVFNGGTLATTATFGLSAFRGIAFTSTGTIDVGSGTTLTYGGIAAGAGGLTQTDSGTLVLSGANTYGGATMIGTGGTLKLGVANSVPSTSDVTVTGTFDTAGFADTIGSLAGAGTVTDSSTAATLTTGGDNASTVFSGPMTASVALTKSGSGTMTLSDASNTYTGKTTIGGGTLGIGADANLGTAPGSATAGQLTFTGGTLATAGSFALSSTRGIALTSTGTIDVATGTTLTYAGIAAGTGLSKTDAGTLVLSGANTYTGATSVGTGGTLALGAANAIPSTSDVTVTGAFDLGGFADTIGSLAGAGSVTDSGAAATLTTNGDNATTAFSGPITGSLALAKAGTGTLTLSDANGYSGATTIGTGGTLKLGAANGVPSTSDVTVTGTFDLGGFADAIGSLAGAGTVTDSSTAATLTTGGDNATTIFSGPMTGSVALTKSGSGTMTLSDASNTYTGKTTIGGGTLSVSADTNLGTPPGSATVGQLTFTGGTLATTATFALAANRGIALTSTGIIDVASGTTLTYAGVAADSGAGLSKLDSGTLILSGTNIYTGPTAIGAGTLQLGIANALSSSTDVTVAGTFNVAGFADTIGSLSGNGTVEDSSATAATLTTNGDNTSTAFTGLIENLTGVLSLTKVGTGTLTLSGTNTYTGTTTASAGTLLVNGAQSGSAVSLNGGTLAGTGTVGAITSTSSGGTVSPGPAGTAGALTSGNINWSTGAPTFVLQLNGATAGSGYDQLSTAGTVNLTGAALSTTVGFTPTNGEVFTIINNTGGNAVTGTFSGMAEGATVSLGGFNFIISYVGGLGHSVTLTQGNPAVGLAVVVSPTGGQNPGTDLVYTTTFTNSGYTYAAGFGINDVIPSNTDFKVGSVTSSLGTTGLGVAVTYSSDGGATYTYTPVSGAGGAGVGYDRNVTNVQWTFTGNLSQTSPNNTGRVSMTARIR